MTRQITTGQDSFLDIVANLVGVLIILVVVVGAHATSSLDVLPPPETELEDKVAALEASIEQTSDIARKMSFDNDQLENQISAENRLAAALTDQRHEMLVQLAVLQREIEQQKADRAEQVAAAIGALDDQQQAMMAAQEAFENSRSELQQELDDLQRELNAVTTNNAPKSETIDHYPNPIAKTVFSQEVHFRLANGKLSYVPMDELIEAMKGEWKLKAEKLQQSPRTIETVGPIRNYRMQYELAAEREVHNSQRGPVERTAVRFKQFHLQPTTQDLGEPVAEALAAGSEFRKVLERFEPRKTTVSIWVYPESFTEHRSLKTWLYEHKFQMASWPLETGRRISGGPQGFKTSAQ